MIIKPSEIGIVLLTVKKSKQIDVLMNHDIYRLDEIETFSSLNPGIAFSEFVYLQRFTTILKEYYNHKPHFYFSYTFDFSVNLQKQSSLNCLYLYKRVIGSLRFFDFLISVIQDLCGTIVF